MIDFSSSYWVLSNNMAVKKRKKRLLFLLFTKCDLIEFAIGICPFFFREKLGNNIKTKERIQNYKQTSLKAKAKAQETTRSTNKRP